MPHFWNSDGNNSVINGGAVRNGGNLAQGYQSAAPLQNSVPNLGANAPFVPSTFFYQNASSRPQQAKNMSTPFQATTISGNSLGQDSSQISQNGFSSHGLNGLIPNGLSQVIQTDAINTSSMPLPNHLHNGINNEPNAIPFAVGGLHNGIQIGNQNNLPNDITMSNGMPIIVPTLFPPFADSSLPNVLQKGIPGTVVPQNLIPSYAGKPSVVDPQNVAKPMDNVTFVQNDMIFDPLTHTPLLWNSLTRTPLVMNPMKDEEISMLSIPREIQPQHFLNVYPITGVPMPTLIATHPTVIKPKKSASEDAAKNKKYAVREEANIIVQILFKEVF